MTKKNKVNKDKGGSMDAAPVPYVNKQQAKNALTFLSRVTMTGPQEAQAYLETLQVLQDVMNHGRD